MQHNCVASRSCWFYMCRTRVEPEAVRVRARAPETAIIICTALCAILRSRWTKWCILFYFIQKLSVNKMDPVRLGLPNPAWNKKYACLSMFLFHCFGRRECLRCLCFQKNSSTNRLQSLLIPQLWFDWNQSTLNTWKWNFNLRFWSSCRGCKLQSGKIYFLLTPEYLTTLCN